MKCQILFSGKNKKNISKCLLKILPGVLSVKSICLHIFELGKDKKTGVTCGRHTGKPLSLSPKETI